jgi:CBS domain-containing protein
MRRTIDGIIADQEVYHVNPQQTVLETARFMAERNIGAVSVLDEDRLVGIVSERDLMKKVVAEGRDPATTRVEEVMSRRLVHGILGDTYEACIAKMLEHNCRHLPILDGDRLIGMVSIRDLYRVDATAKAEELDAITEYIYSSPKVAQGSN